VVQALIWGKLKWPSISLLSLHIIFVWFWRWCISIKRIVFLDFIHCLVSQEQKIKNYRQKIKTWTDQNTNVHLMTETEAVSEMLCRCFLYVLGLCAICVCFPRFVCSVLVFWPLLCVEICEWLCHLLPPVFFLVSSVYVCVCVRARAPR
jgi:hypothetical protein